MGRVPFKLGAPDVLRMLPSQISRRALRKITTRQRFVNRDMKKDLRREKEKILKKFKSDAGKTGIL